MKKITFCILVLLFCLATSLFTQKRSADEIAIREIIEQFTDMWTKSNGASIFQKISSETNFLFLTNNTSLNRDAFIKLITQLFRENPATKHIHTIKKIVISGALTYEYGIVEIVRKNGQVTKNETLNVFFKEASGWKLIGNLPVVELKNVLIN